MTAGCLWKRIKVQLQPILVSTCYNICTESRVVAERLCAGSVYLSHKEKCGKLIQNEKGVLWRNPPDYGPRSMVLGNDWGRRAGLKAVLILFCKGVTWHSVVVTEAGSKTVLSARAQPINVEAVFAYGIPSQSSSLWGRAQQSY
jgi:hypothetical protein